MPLIKEHQINVDTKLGVWHCSETIPQLLDMVGIDSDDRNKCASFKNQQRQKQFLAVRILCSKLIGTCKIMYRPGGMPYLFEKEQHISISHSHNYVAIIISTTPFIGIDIQKIDNKILRIRNRFVNDEDKKIIDFENIKHLTLLWCVKESLYKINGDPKVFFKEHMRLDQWDNQTPNQLKASINLPLYHRKHQFKFEILENYVLVYTVFD
ncbi:MAG: 4'-phosphopantetheinyl transferase superfamily protein [Flavobacteriales bacterium]|nr:4'-phosphopantetheinyl transferase superfamily protein [Flavobacteriales bacterium]